MQKLLCATSNKIKFDIGRVSLEPFGIELVQRPLTINEIQGEDPKLIIMDKAARAFAVLQQPVVVSDDSWDIPGLNGFPGPYMKSILQWFTADDFIRLTKDLTDRRILLHCKIAYQDAQHYKLFEETISGTLQTEARGAQNEASMQIVSLDIDQGLTFAEIYDAGREHEPARMESIRHAWRELGAWYKDTFGSATS